MMLASLPSFSLVSLQCTLLQVSKFIRLRDKSQAVFRMQFRTLYLVVDTILIVILFLHYLRQNALCAVSHHLGALQPLLFVTSLPYNGKSVRGHKSCTQLEWDRVI